MDKSEDYLAKAKEADAAAIQAQSPVAKNSWRTIAETYRQMGREAAHLKSQQQTKVLS